MLTQLARFKVFAVAVSLNDRTVEPHLNIQSLKIVIQILYKWEVYPKEKFIHFQIHRNIF